MTPSLHWQTCTVCGTHFLGKQRKIGVNVFCSQECRNLGKQRMLRVGGVPPLAFDPSPLNIAVTDAYQRCLAAGTHRPGATLTRYRNWRGHDAPMPICSTCDVPFPDLSVGFRFSTEAA